MLEHEHSRVPRRRGSALIVEDSPTDGAMLRDLLETLGCICDIAMDGKEGVMAALSGSYDFVFMDLAMPRLDGFAATLFIHEEMGPLSPFIVAVTGSRSAATRRRCLQAGMDYFIAKPVHRADLEVLVED